MVYKENLYKRVRSVHIFNRKKKQAKAQFQRIILSWYRKKGRHTLPWRKTRNPYKILVSEIMLQQTQIVRVIPKYKEWIKRFPTISTLAQAAQRDVLSHWHGLGYNRRALFLHRASQLVIHEFDGVFPHDISEIEKLPGVGPYTARAVSVFSWNQPRILLETNIRRVILHFFFSGLRGVSDKRVREILAHIFYEKQPRIWNWALMDYGAGPLKNLQNANRGSKHYTKQSRFEGSRRYVRAKIISLLIEKVNSGVLLKYIYSKMKNNPHTANFGNEKEVKKIIRDLEREGFLIQKKEKLFIAG